MTVLSSNDRQTLVELKPPKAKTVMSDLVQCYSGSSYAERPRALVWQGNHLEIAEILAQWHSPGKLSFRVRVEDGRVFELNYLEADDEWHIQIA